MKLTIFSGLAMASSQCHMEVSHLYLVSELKTALQNLPRRLVCNPLTPTHPSGCHSQMASFPHKCDYINHQWIKPRDFSYETFILKWLAQEHTVSERSVTWNYHSWLGRVPPANKDNAFVLAENMNRGESSLT